MPIASGKRATPARKKAKLDHDSASTSNDPDVSAAQDVPNVSQGSAAKSSISTSTPSRGRPKRSAQKAATSYAEPSAADNDEAYVPTPTPPPPAATCIDMTPSASLPLVTFATPPPPKSAKGKAKAKSEDDDYDDDDADETRSFKDPDLEIFTRQAPLRDLNRNQLKTTKARALRQFWLQGPLHPTFFGVPASDLIRDVRDEEEDSKPNAAHGDRALQDALPWPNDGLANTWLDSEAYPKIKKSLMKFWHGYVGWIPKEGVYDMEWYPGKATGYRENQQRGIWAQNARQAIRRGANADQLLHSADRTGWPFVQPWLDTHRRDLTILTAESARSFQQDLATPQRVAIRHPTTVMKLTVPELAMRGRLKKPAATDTSKTPRKSRIDGDAEADETAEKSDDEIADEDENAIAAIDANQEPIDLEDPKFANIPNLGYEEKGPLCGDVLEISIGPPGEEKKVQISKGTSRRLDSVGVVPDEGHIMNAGGHVYAVDWVPVPVHLNRGKEYFVVSAAGSTAPTTFIGQKQPRPAPASLQIWSVSPDSPPVAEGLEGEKGEAKLEMVVCHEAGAAYKLAFCPAGHDYVAAGEEQEEEGKESRCRRLGLLAGCFADGSLSIFSIPNPDSVRSCHIKSKANVDAPMYIHLDPILRLEHPQQSATSLSWAGGELLAFGGSQGWIGVWNIGSLLRQSSPTSSPTPPPDYIVRAHRSAIMDLTFILVPPISSSGLLLPTSPPLTLFSVSLDGWTSYIDLRRASSTSIDRSRAVHYSCAFSHFTGGSLVHENADGSVSHYSLRPEEFLRARSISYAPSRVVSLSSSPFHPMIAVGTAHGEVKTANIFRTLRRSQRNHVPIYQQVLDRNTGELMVKHHLIAEVANNAEPKKWGVAQWHPTLAVTAVRWNPNLGRCRLLLSATAGGMVKVDFVKPPYE